MLLFRAIIAITAILKHLAISINSMLFKYVKIACYSLIAISNYFVFILVAILLLLLLLLMHISCVTTTTIIACYFCYYAISYVTTTTGYGIGCIIYFLYLLRCYTLLFCYYIFYLYSELIVKRLDLIIYLTE